MRKLLAASLIVFTLLEGSAFLPGCAAQSGSPFSISLEEPPTAGLSAPPDMLIDGGKALWESLPAEGVLLSLSRWGSTTLAVLDVPRGILFPVAAKPTGEMSIALAGGKVAYLVQEGVNPARNHVEILDLRKGRAKILKPADGFAILGFALSPDGKKLAYAEINLRLSSSRHVHWRTGIADLETYQTTTSLTSSLSLPGEGIPVPFAWSGTTGEIYTQRLAPFRGGATRGVWVMKPDGSGFRELLSEVSYSVLPHLSPEGRRLAYLATKVDALPQGFIPSPGALPGNVLLVMDLETGEEVSLAQEPGVAFGPLAWSPSGREIALSRREWQEGRFQDVAFIKAGRDSLISPLPGGIAPSPSSRVAELAWGAKGLLWVEEDKEGARLLTVKDSHPSTLLSLPEGKIHIIEFWEG